MNNLRFFTSLIFLSATLLSFSCSPSERKEQVEAKVIQLNEIEETKKEQVNEQENTKNTKAEIILGKDSELTTEGLTQNRDMSQYDQGGHFDCRSWIAKDKPHGECNENKIRDFIWQHWTKKKQGYLRITYNTVDATSTLHIFIEANENGEWNVAWRIARSHAMPQYNNQITDIWGISIEQVIEKPKKGSWAIIFKNSSGKIIRKIPDYDE